MTVLKNKMLSKEIPEFVGNWNKYRTFKDNLAHEAIKEYWAHPRSYEVYNDYVREFDRESGVDE
jgi:hypothetical protein